MRNWKKIRLGDIAETITKGTTPTTIGYDFIINGINFIKIEAITENGDFRTDLFKHISLDCNKALSRSQLKKNDILFSIAGALGRVAIVTDDILPANINQALSIIRISSNLISHNYLFYVLKTADVLKQFDKVKRGNAQLNLSLEDVKNITIPYPPLEEQKRIVKIIENKLSDTESLREKCLEQLSYIQAMPSSILKKAFNGDY